VVLVYKLFSDKTDVLKTTPRLNIKGYRLVYTDQKEGVDTTKVIVSEMFNSKKYGLRGKPDYIFLKNNKKDMIVTEVKSGKIGDKTEPHYGDKMQLVAYFLMVEDTFRITPSEGRIIYKDHMFIITNTKKLRAELLEILNDMRDMLDTGDKHVKPSFAMCRHCICNNTVCNKAGDYSNNKGQQKKA